MKSDDRQNGPGAEEPDGSSLLHLQDSDFARQEPIPLDVIASELKRQSEFLVGDRKPGGKALDKTPSDPHAAPTPEMEAGDPRARPLQFPAKEDRVPRKSSDILTDRLLQARQRAEQAEREQEAVSAQNRQLREQVRDLERRLEQGIGNLQDRVALDGAGSAGDEAEALRRELELVRTHAAQDLAALREQLSAAPATGGHRNVELEAELQASRQEVALLRQSVKDKDNVLEDLAGQCRGLEDVLEDRDREIERLRRELSEAANHAAPADAPPALEPANVERASEILQGFQEKDSSDALDDAGLIYVPSSSPSWKTYLIGGLGGLLLAVLLLEALTLASGRGELFSFLLHGDETAQRAAPSPPSRPSAGEDAVAAAPRPAQIAAATPETVPSREIAEFRDRLADGSAGPRMLRLPGASFLMGGKSGLAPQDEQPSHQVAVKPFAIGRHEVTFAEYDRFARATGRALPDDAGWGRGRRPVINVSWDDASAYARWLSAQTGETYRLPTEAEWEYAARGGASDRYWWGFSPESGRAVCFDCGTRWDNRSTAEVGSLEPNPFGLHDTAGNVMEWVQDCSNRDYRGAPVDGSAWLSGDCSQRMVRGGAYNKPIGSLRSAARSRLPQESRFGMLGFRLARD